MEIQRTQVLGKFMLRHLNAAGLKSGCKFSFLRALNTCIGTPFSNLPSQKQNKIQIYKSLPRQMNTSCSNPTELPTFIYCQCGILNHKDLLKNRLGPHISCRSFNRSLRTSTACRVRRERQDERTDEYADEHHPSDTGMNLRLHVENDYLSWMRNTYISTLAGISMINFDFGSMGTIAGGAVLLASGLNLTVGSIGYIYNLSNIRKREHMSGLMCRIMQLWVVVHFILWYIVLVLLFPEFNVIEEKVLEEEDRLIKEEANLKREKAKHKNSKDM